jgi:biotin operon repressor
LAHPELSRAEKAMFLRLARQYINDDGFLELPPLPYVCAQLGVSERTIVKHLKNFRERGVLQ